MQFCTSIYFFFYKILCLSTKCIMLSYHDTDMDPGYDMDVDLALLGF
jgi:hypothetical protein